jgi:hypothetical protein
MALDMARAVHTPLPLPDMSSPSRSFANLSFIISTSDKLMKRIVYGLAVTREKIIYT